MVRVVSGLQHIPNGAHQLLQLKQQESCDYWAQHDGECVNNPKYMWHACYGSCLTHATNTEDRCESWAQEGECVNNPNYIHINCPDSCGNAIAWNPWVRRDLGIVPIDVDASLGKDSDPFPRNILDASEIMRDRVKKYVNGLHSVVEGMTSTAPTEFLGMLGLAEAVVYTARLQELVMQFAEINDHIDGHRDVISDIVNTIKKGYQPDFIYRSMLRWVEQIDASAKNIGVYMENHHAEKDDSISSSHAEGLLNGYDFSFERFAEQFSGVQVDYDVEKSKINTESHTVLLNNGIEMPKVGFGTWQLEGAECVEAVLTAIRNGYTFFDSAQAYRNEHDLGNAIKQAIDEGLTTRSNLFIATKISDESDAGYQNVKKLINRQLHDLRTDYIDLYMLHSPISDKRVQIATWKALEELYDHGVIKAIGVSNFDVSELQELMKNARIKPMVVQNKLDIYHIGKQMDNSGINNVRFCLENGIILLSYSPFSAYPFMMQPVDDPIVRYLVERRIKHGESVTGGQLILKWIAQRGMAMIPRSSNSKHQKENIDALKIRQLDRTEVTLLDLCQFLIGHPFAFAINMPTIGIY